MSGERALGANLIHLVTVGHVVGAEKSGGHDCTSRVTPPSRLYEIKTGE